MRCPKCGYISFDRQISCGRCSTDLTSVAEQLKGTAGKAAAPLFLGAVLREQAAAGVEPDPVLHETEGQARPAAVDEIDSALAPPDEIDLEDQPLSSFALKEIDVSDLIPSQKEEEMLRLSLDEEEDALVEIEFPPLEPDEFQSLAGPEISTDGLEMAEDEEIVDLCSLVNSEETPAPATAKGKADDIFAPSFGADEHPPADTPQKPASAEADIPDLGLTLENDDQQ